MKRVVFYVVESKEDIFLLLARYSNIDLMMYDYPRVISLITVDDDDKIIYYYKTT